MCGYVLLAVQTKVQSYCSRRRRHLSKYYDTVRMMRMDTIAWPVRKIMGTFAPAFNHTNTKEQDSAGGRRSIRASECG